MCAADACAFLRLCDAETGRLTPEDPEHWPSVRLERRPQGGSRPLLRVRGPGVRAHLARHWATRSVVRFLTRSQGRKRGRKEPGRERGQPAGPAGARARLRASAPRASELGTLSVVNVEMTYLRPAPPTRALPPAAHANPLGGGGAAQRAAARAGLLACGSGRFLHGFLQNHL